MEGKSDVDLVKTALYVGLRVRSPFTDQERKTVQNALKAKMSAPGQSSAFDGMSDTELLKSAIAANVPLKLTLDKDDRSDLVKETKYQLEKLPSPAELGTNPTWIYCGMLRCLAWKSI